MLADAARLEQRKEKGMNSNVAATVAGYAMAALTAAQPVINTVQGSFHQEDWFKLGIAILMAIFGHKTSFNVKPQPE